MTDGTELTVIMPAFNEEANIQNSITKVMNTLDKNGIDYEIIVVDDGSIDNTKNRAMEIKDPRVKIVGYEKNVGKGYAIKFGFQYAKGKYVIFFDSDLNILPDEIVKFLNIIKSENRDIVIGSKRLKSSVIKNYSLLRKLLSISYHLYVKALFRINIMDTQVGIKIFKREVLERIFEKTYIKKYAFDVEILMLAQKLGYEIKEAPVVINVETESHIKPKNIAAMFIDTFAIYYRLKITRDKNKRYFWKLWANMFLNNLIEFVMF